MEDQTHIGDLESTIKLLQDLSLMENQQPPSAPPLPTAPATSFHRSQWVDLFVNEMAGATSMEDARSRASKTLEIMEGLRLQEVDTVKRENSLLKRAVCIQYQQMKKLEEEKETFKEKLRRLEIDNYALSLHLKQLPSGGLGPHGSYFLPPDVF